MNIVLKTSSRALFLSCAAGLALAQQPVSPTPPPAPVSPAAKSSAQIDAGEPRANTMPAAAGATAAVTPAAETPPSPAAPPAGRNPKSPSAPRNQGMPAVAGGQKGSAAADRLNLNTATVTGDREQPKVMYIVPWKSSNIGDLSGKPMNSLLDEALAPVDREEFRREVAYYDAVRADPSQNGAPAAAAKQGEK